MREPEQEAPSPGDGAFSDYVVPTIADQDLEVVAVQKVLEYESHSQLVQRSSHDQVAQFQWSDLRVGELLGSGTFASAYHVTIKRIQDVEDTSMSPHSHAMKVLHEKTLSDRKTFLASAVDLAIEAKLLAGLCHENIIELHGVRAGSFQESLASCDYFLILDLLVQTLQEYLKHERFQWMQTQRGQWFRHKRQYDAQLVHDSETIAFGLARGMEYLHSQSVCFRDLKPANVGFDARGTVKIFDFGLAREVYGNKKLLGGRPVGSPRYMAPEVAKCEPHSLSADVYSFGIILWELCSLQKAYRTVNDVSQYKNRIVLGNERPSLNKTCFHGSGSKLKSLLQGCWHPLPKCRPSFTTVCRELETDLKGNYDNDAKQERRLLPDFSSLRMRRREEGRRQGRGEKGRLFWQKGPAKDEKSTTSYHEEEGEVLLEHKDGPVVAKKSICREQSTLSEHC